MTISHKDGWGTQVHAYIWGGLYFEGMPDEMQMVLHEHSDGVEEHMMRLTCLHRVPA